jgi:phosphoribosylaminoimidazole-succinocarboxamide synthase
MSLFSIEQQAIANTNFQGNAVHGVYHGKVRDVYDLGDKLLMVATDRISAFDCILPRPIPYKGQVLNQIAAHFLAATRSIVPNWFELSPDPNVSVGAKADPIKIEMVIRGYVSGHAWRLYKAGIREICGVAMPEGLKEHDAFPSPIITPTTKAAEGHDADISAKEILEQKLMSSDDWHLLESYTRALYRKGSEMAAERGLILVDTKYEFGRVGDQIVLIDEIHTPDSSRYFYKEGYEERQSTGVPQQQLSKEFVREWLMANNFQGLDGQAMPEMPDEFVWEISARYIKLYELITGRTFDKAVVTDITRRIEKNISSFLN